MAWKDRVRSYQEATAVTHEIRGMGELRFFPNRIAQLQQLRAMSASATDALAVLFTDQRGDADAITETSSEGSKEEGFTQQKTTVSAVGTDVMEFRAKEQSRAIEQLFDLLDRRNLMLLGEMFMDSLREEFLYAKQRSPQEVEEFLFGSTGEEDHGEGAMDITLFAGLIQGWMKANAKVFGAVGEKLVGLVKDRFQNVSLLEQEGAESPTSGDSSSPASSPQLVTASPSSESTS